MNELGSPSLWERVQKVVAEEQKVPVEKITLEATFEELGIDSLDGIHLLFALESEFGISIPDDAVKQVKTIRELADGLQMLLDQKAAGAPAPATDSNAPA